MGYIFTPYSQLHCWMCEMRNGKKRRVVYNVPIIPSANNFKYEVLLKFLLKLVFFSGFFVYVQLFHFNGKERNLFIAIKVKLLNLHIGA